MLRRRELMADRSELPAGYRLCKYLDSDGKQSIDTGIMGGLDTRGVVFSFKANRRGLYYILGNFNQVGQCGIMLKPSDADTVVLAYYTANQQNTPERIEIGATQTRIDFQNLNNKIVVNGVEVADLPADTYKLKNSRLMLFGTGIGTKFNGSGLCYALTVYSDLSKSEILRNYIPALDNNGNPCMFDTISKTPFYNAGKGEFGYELMDGTYVAPV